jgi:hypothetical protein
MFGLEPPSPLEMKLSDESRYGPAIDGRASLRCYCYACRNVVFDRQIGSFQRKPHSLLNQPVRLGIATSAESHIE